VRHSSATCLQKRHIDISYAILITYLNGTGSNMTIVRKTSGEGRSIVECVQGLALSELELLLESVDVLPVLKYLLFLLGEVGSLGNYI